MDLQYSTQGDFCEGEKIMVLKGVLVERSEGYGTVLDG